MQRFESFRPSQQVFVFAKFCPAPSSVSVETRMRTAEPANSGPFGSRQEISDSARLRGGAGRIRTSNQTVMSEAPTRADPEACRRRRIPSEAPPKSLCQPARGLRKGIGHRRGSVISAHRRRILRRSAERYRASTRSRSCRAHLRTPSTVTSSRQHRSNSEGASRIHNAVRKIRAAQLFSRFQDLLLRRSILTVPDVVHPPAVHRQHLCSDPS